jgi:hypothetical protein
MRIERLGEIRRAILHQVRRAQTLHISRNLIDVDRRAGERRRRNDDDLLHGLRLVGRRLTGDARTVGPDLRKYRNEGDSCFAVRSRAKAVHWLCFHGSGSTLKGVFPDFLEAGEIGTDSL